MRLLLHTAAYSLVLTIRATIPRLHPLARAEFATIRLRLLKLAARISKAGTRVRIAFTVTCPVAAPFRSLANAICCQPP
jgi:Transposase DDE domain group 1